MRPFFGLLALLACAPLAGCPPDDDDDVVGSDCPVEDRFTSDPDAACAENFCGAPTVQPATGSSEPSFTLLQDGDVLPIWWGPQGGYHIDMAARMSNLCPVVFLDFALYDVTGGGETLVHSVRRHVQAVREGGDPQVPSIQRWWVEQFRFPCAWWPDDPNPDHVTQECPDEPLGFLDQLDLKLVVAAEDHNEDRSAVAEVAVTASCCNE